LIENPGNRQSIGRGDVAEEFSGLQALLSFADGALTARLRVTGGEPLTDVAVTYRLPVQWADGVVRHRIDRIDGEYVDVLNLEPARSDYKYAAGDAFFVAQVDFRRGESVGRLHLSCTGAPPERDPAYPQGGFLVLGPVASSELTREKVRPMAEARAWGRTDALGGAAWRPETESAQAVLDPEVVATTGAWRGDAEDDGGFMLRSLVTSHRPQDASLLLSENAEGVFVNGAPLNEGTCRLRKGANELVIVVAPPSAGYSRTNAGCFVRLVRPGSRARLEGVAFHLPKS
jgi:hypothetical protein